MTVRLCLTVEGPSELQFASTLLREHLAEHGVMLPKPRMTLFSRRHRMRHRGGVRSYEPLKNDITCWLRQENKDRRVRFSTMIDLYRLPRNFPGFAEAASLSDPYARVESLEVALAKAIGDPRFIPYLQLHEFEALLLADPSKFTAYYPDAKREVAQLQEMVAGFDNPERIDSGEQTAPSKRIIALFPDYLDAKPAATAVIAPAVGLTAMRARCPHFNHWLSRLESLGTPDSP